MDSLTHIALGAVIGHAYAGKSLGRKAMVIGGLAQSIPDVDFIAGSWLAPVDDLLAHRGITHSLFFAIILSLLLGRAIARWGRTALPWTKWAGFFLLEITVHLLLDSLNNYGTGWFEPFSHVRVAFNTIYVADPFYTIWPTIACTVMFILGGNHPHKKYWARWSIIISTCYLVYGMLNKSEVFNEVSSSLAKQKITYTRLFMTPSPFNSWLWFYAAETDSGFYTGYRSVFESGDVALSFHSRNEHLSKKAIDADAVLKLKRFSNGYYTLEEKKDTLIFNDLRFGQVAGWSNPNAPFAFHYYLDYPYENLLVVQRGRFENLNKKTLTAFAHRIAGKK